MGASGWQYFVPYQSNIQQAFEALRLEEFENLNYRQDRTIPFEVLQQGFEIVYSDSDLTQEERIAARDTLYFPYLNAPKIRLYDSITEMVEDCAEEGTHSILDMREVATEKGFGVCAPLSTVHLIAYFGTDKPTRELVDVVLDKPTNYDYQEVLIPVETLPLSQYLQLVANRWRGEGTYILIYKDEVPDEILFIGYSGD